MKRVTGLVCAGALCGLLGAVPAVQAAPAIDLVDIDLSPLIDESVRHSERFAVDIPHAASAASQGHWSTVGGISTWTYTVRIPAAVSLSFHASILTLPPSAVLTVSGAQGRLTYRARDVNRGGLWARPLPGDTLTLSLSVSSADFSKVRLEIASLQAGYRSLGGAFADNPHYRQIAAAAQLAACTQNYACDVTSANQNPGNATVAILIANIGQCTGTLLTDTSQDGTPYVLTARHCEGATGGGDPGAAASVTVFWDAVTPCGTALGSIYDGNAVTQSGATTVVEQQDAWLIRLDAPPEASDAYYAGWDATGASFVGGYSIHHSLGYDKQYVTWNGQAVPITIPGATFGIGYSSNFWGLVNATGNVGAGASGGAAFDANNRVIGSLSRADLPGGPDTAGVCPVTPPPAPSPSTLTALYSALGSVWDSTSDATSTTGSLTLRAVLDAAGTGQTVASGYGSLPAVTLTTSAASQNSYQTITLSWNAPGAQSCSATGGMSGDGWSGTLAASGSLQLTETTGGQVSYGVRCTAGTLIGNARTAVSWTLQPAFVNLAVSPPVTAAGNTIQLQWFANTTPCTATGGTAADGWAGAKSNSGTQNVPVLSVGSITYTLSCGSGSQVATGQQTVTANPPSAAISADGTQLRFGQPVNLSWTAEGTCTQSGGATGDGWGGALAGPGSSTQAVTEAAAGTYTYTITCMGGGQQSQASATVVFTNAAAANSLVANPTSEEVFGDPNAPLYNPNLTWTSNVRPCALTYTGPGNVHGSVPLQGNFPGGTAWDSEAIAGVFNYVLNCGTGTNQVLAGAAINWFTNAPAVTLTGGGTWAVGMPNGLAWNSNVFPCTGSGGVSGDGWIGSKAGPVGNQSVTESATGTDTFTISCGSGAQVVQAQTTATVIVPTATITASAGSLQVGQPLTIRWNATLAPCASSITPGSAGGWGTVLGSSGGFQTTENAPGTYTYAVNCQGAQASTQVTFTPGPVQTVSVAAAPTTATVSSPVMLTWSTSNVSTCSAAGGTSGDGWTGSLPTSGSQQVTTITAGIVTYSLVCYGLQGATQGATQVTYTGLVPTEPVTTPAATLSASPTSQVLGQSTTLSWSSTNASACTATGGSGADGWTGSLALSGSMSITESAAGSYNYSIVCSGAPPAATATAAVHFTQASSSGGSAGGGGGGGGELDLLWSLFLSLVVLWRVATKARRRGALCALRRRAACVRPPGGCSPIPAPPGYKGR